MLNGSPHGAGRVAASEQEARACAAELDAERLSETAERTVRSLRRQNEELSSELASSRCELGELVSRHAAITEERHRLSHELNDVGHERIQVIRRVHSDHTASTAEMRWQHRTDSLTHGSGHDGVPLAWRDGLSAI